MTKVHFLVATVALGLFSASCSNLAIQDRPRTLFVFCELSAIHNAKAIETIAFVEDTRHLKFLQHPNCPETRIRLLPGFTNVPGGEDFAFRLQASDYRRERTLLEARFFGELIMEGQDNMSFQASRIEFVGYEPIDG